MAPMASIFDPVRDSQKPAILRSAVRDNPVSVVSAGVAYQGIRTPGELVEALLREKPMWNSESVPMVSLQQLQEAAGLGYREARKLDRFSLLALAAAKAAVHHSQMDMSVMSNCGIYSGNMVGGWTFTEPQVRALHSDGLASVSPYLATAWFPGAPQGQISIHLGLTGFAKTVATDRCSGAQAVGLAFERVGSGLKPDLLLAGGAEAPATPFVGACLAQIMENDARAVEAAAYLILSAGEGGEVQIKDHGTFSIDLRWPDLVERLEAEITGMLSQADALPELVLCNFPLVTAFEDQLCSKIRTVLGKGVQLFFPTQVFGETLAASGALACVAAWEMLAQHPSSRSALVISLGHQCGDLLLFSKSGGHKS